MSIKSGRGGLSLLTTDMPNNKDIDSQNVYKKYMWTELLLNKCVNSSDIIFIQEPLWGQIRNVASMKDKVGDSVMGMLKHLAWR